MPGLFICARMSLPDDVKRNPVNVEASLVFIISVNLPPGILAQVDNVQEPVLGITEETIET
jgi:hypothetical protein